MVFLIVASCARPGEDRNSRNFRDEKPRWDGVTLASELAGKGFKCSPRPEGDICVIPRVSIRGGLNYSQAIAILIPTGVVSPHALHLYLHGHRGVCEPASASAEYFADSFALLKQMVGAGYGDSVVVFPMSSGKCTTYYNELVPSFSSFTDWATNLLHPSSNIWTVAGHSGAGAIMSSAFVKNLTFVNNLDSAFLLDAAYSMGSHIGEWKSATKANPNLKIYSTYISGTSPATGSSQLKAGLPGKRVSIEVSKATGHCTVPTKDYGRLLEKSIIDHWRNQSRPISNEEFIQPKPSLVM